MLGGFNNQLDVVDYPREWYEVNNYLNKQSGDFNVLFFPWHGFMRFSFSERIIANPASDFFNRPTIRGENVEVGPVETQSPKPIQHYIHFLLSHRNEIGSFGELVAPLNVKYIILAKEVDYREYGFLYNQADLRVVLDNPKMVVFENLHKTSKIYWIKDIRMIKSWEEVLKVSKHEDIMEHAWIIGEEANIFCQPIPQYEPLVYTKLSPIEYRVKVPFNEGYVVFAEPYNEGWVMNGEKPLANLGLTNAFPVKHQGTYRIYFQKFNIFLTYYIISLATFIVCVALYIHSYLKNSSLS